MGGNTAITQIIQDRWESLPTELKVVFRDNGIAKQLDDIAMYHSIDAAGRKIIENEMLLVLFGFEPITQLSRVFQVKLGLDAEKAMKIASEIELLVFGESVDLLKEIANDPQFVALSDSYSTPSDELPKAAEDTREKLELRPGGVSGEMGEGHVAPKGPKPLTRDEVLKALAPHRTMAGDIASLKEKDAPTETPETQAPVEGYAAYRGAEEGKGESQ